MKLKQIFTCAICAASTCLWGQTSFNAIVGVEYQKASASSQVKETGAQFDGTYYFSPVLNTTLQPFGELDFVQKISSVKASYVAGKVEDPVISEGPLKIKGLEGKFYWDSLVVNLQYIDETATVGLKSNLAYSKRVQANQSLVGLGYLIAKNSELGFRYSDLKASYNVSVGMPVETDRSIATNTVYSHSVIGLYGGRFMVTDFSYGLSDFRQNTQFTRHETNANVRFYPTSQIYFEAGISSTNSSSKVYAGRSSLYAVGFLMTPRLSGVVKTEKFDAEDGNVGYGKKYNSLNIAYRF
jgi:hypothetical protein